MASSRSSIVSALIRAWGSELRGRVLLSAWAATFASVTLRAVYQRRLAKKRLALAVKPVAPGGAADAKVVSSGATARPAPSPLRQVVKASIPRWSSPPVLWCTVLSTGIGLRLLVQVKTSQEIGALGSLLSKREWSALYRRQLVYALYAIPAALFAALQKFAAGRAALAMRAHLTSTLHAHYASASSLTAALSSIQGSEAEGDGMQRMSADVDAFCTQAITTFEAIFKPSVEAILISTKLAMLMGPSQLGACAGFFGLAGSWVRMVGPSFATLAANVQAADGALLAHRARVHAHTEEIDMLRGAATERALMDDSATLAQSMASRLQLQRFASDVLDTYVLRYVGILAALTAMLPALASSAAGVDDPTEYFLTCLHLLVQMSLKQNLVYPDLEGSAAATATNAELLEVLRRVGLERLTQGSEERLTAPGGCEGLSPGECQRLCLGRLLVRRPEIAILDEPCASMEEAFEETFFRSAASAGVSLVAIAHHAKLERFHTHVLELDGRGEAVLKRM